MKTSLQYEITKLFDIVEDKDTGERHIDFKKNYAFPIDLNFKRILKYINDLIDMENTRAGRSPMVYNWLENFDTTYSAEFMFYMLTGTELINNAKLKVVGSNYRGYSGSITSGGSGVTGSNGSHQHTSAGSHQHSSAGNHSHGYSSISSGGKGASITGSTGSATPNVTGQSGQYSGTPAHVHTAGTYACGSHSHTARGNLACASHTHSYRDRSGSAGSHTHPSTGSHTHPSTGSHTHGVGTHTHGLSLNITEGNNPTGVNIYIDDGSGYGDSIASDNSPVDIEIDIKSHLTTTVGWKKLKVTSTREGRISVTLILDVNLLAL